MKNKKVVVGMSGGVDSSVAAYLLKEQGYDVIGVTMQMFHENDEYIVHKDGGCGGQNAIEDARRVAKILDIPFHIVSFRDEFKEKVMEYFVNEYQNARTPNPCVHCNRWIKWEALLNKAKELGADYIATGHYARIDRLPNGRYSIKTSATATKDQTYVLYNLTQEQLSKTLMPVGGYTKEEIREIAEKINLKIANKPDSQDICFIPDGDYVGFIERLTKSTAIPGNFVDKEGNVLGKHKGLINYTVGQRKGLNLAMGHPVFVTELRTDTNEVVIGENEDIFTTKVYANKINAMSIENFANEVRALGKIRYAHKGAMCTVKRINDDKIECVFDEPQRAVTPGQSLVLYDGDYVMGGGTIVL
ncbi:MAG: tRNA 2-thiouridine(34) synthase MnmA [Lachnospiraceae bacterium]|nr:tRNA 2-thiouridine(34) synthase MnmA [Lachnospiraceae bacterium]